MTTPRPSESNRAMIAGIDRTVCVAPMMARTDRHFRYLVRLITPRAMLYTEMVTTGALLRGDTRTLLQFHPAEHPVALQVGGSDPVDMARCAREAAARGFDEINVNVGCPSDRVQTGRFGACLMAEPRLVAECVTAMRDAAPLPVSVKTRVGIDDLDRFDDLRNFVDTVASRGCTVFIVHARKAWLKGLSPKENRNVPPLRYDRVYRLKAAFPELEIVLNGGVSSMEQCAEHLKHLDGVMLGREAYRNPYVLAGAGRSLFGENAPPPTRHAVAHRYLAYASEQLAQGVPLNHLTRHMTGLFQGLPGARAWRRHLSEHACRRGAGLEVVETALDLVAPARTGLPDAACPPDADAARNYF